MTYCITAKSGRKILMLMIGMTFSEAVEAAEKLEAKAASAEEFSIEIRKETGK